MKRLVNFLIGLLFISLMASTVHAALPNVTVISPNGGSIFGTWELEATATDSDGYITNVDFYHNDNGSGWMFIGTNTSVSGTSHYFDWDTTVFSNGNNYSIKAIAIDNNSDTANDTSDAMISVANIPPTVTVDYPNGGETLSDDVTITATASDDVSVNDVTFSYSEDNGGNWTLFPSGTDTSSPYTYDWNTTAYPNGTQYLIKAVATDDLGLTSNDTSDSNFTVINIPNVPPIVSVIWPNGNETISNGTITLKASANDPDGSITKVDFYYTTNGGTDKNLINSATTGPTYEVSWATLGITNGPNYQIIAIATDNRSVTTSDISNNTFLIANNHSPTLTNGKSNISSGISPLKVRFTVEYKDIDNDTGTVDIYIDGTSHAMTAADSNAPDVGITYEYITTLTASTSSTDYSFYFEADDGVNSVETTSPKTVTVNPATFESGNRIWDESASMSTTYTWNPQSFSGFYYDLDTDEGGETLTIEDIDSSLGSGDIIYKTSPIPVNFEYGTWGKYNVIGFMAERYFAGYRDVTTFASSSENLLAKRQLSKVLLDTDDRYRVNAGSALELEEGYEFMITEFGSGGDAVMVGLFKDGGKVKEDIVSEGDTFVYKKDLGSARDIPILAIYIKTVFTGIETSTVIVEGIFQISDSYTDVDPGDEFGQMEISSTSSSGITMKNDRSVSLGAGDDFNLMGKINIIVADSSTLRFAPYVDMSEPGTYELRGTVTDDASFDWTPFNFEALLYDIDIGDGDETLHIGRSGRTVAANQLTYTTKPIDMKFEHSGDGWNEFQSIGFMGDTYFAGYKSGSAFVSSDRSLVDEGKLSKILIDEDKRHTLYIGNSLPLQEGYSLRIDEISRSGGALMFTILKDGEEIDTDIANEGDNYVYEIEVDKTDIPIIVVHIDSVFRGMETNSVFIDGIFQISESFTTVENGDSYGIMEVTSASSTSIVMKNKDDSFSLGEGDTISIMGDINIKVADDSTVRFYPFKEVIVEEPLYLELEIPSSVYQNEDLTIKVTSDGDEVKGAAIKFGDAEIGTTDSSGELVYVPEDAGSFTVTASMSGYESDSDDIEVLYQPKVLMVSAPLVVDRGESIVISVTSEGAGISGASVKFGNKDLGTTPASGNITYTPDEVGTFTISASKSGYQDATKDIDITDPGAKLVFSNLTIKPKIVEPGENVNITVQASNFGTLREAQTMYLKVNGEDVASHDLILGPGEIVTIQFNMNRSKSGTYLVEVDGRSDTFKVTGLELGSTSIIVLGIIAVLSTTAIVYSISQGTLTLDIIAVKAQAFERMLRHLVEK